MKIIRLILAIFVFFFLFSSSASATIKDDLLVDLYHNYNFSTGTGTTLYDTQGHGDGTISAATWDAVETYAGIDYSLDFAPGSAYVSITASNFIADNGTFTNVICQKNGGDDQDQIFSGFVGGQERWIVSKTGSAGSGVSMFLVGDGYWGYPYAAGSTIACNQWICYFYMWDTSTNIGKVYTNSSVNVGSNSGARTHAKGTLDVVYLGAQRCMGCTDDFDYNGNIAVFQTFNRTLNTTEIDYIAENPDWFNNVSTPTEISINISNPSIKNNSQFNNINLNFNLTMNSTYSNSNCSFYLNGIINGSLTELGAGNNINVVFEKELLMGKWNYSISCFDNTTTKTTTTNTFYIDVINPNIVSTFINNSIYYDQNLTANFTFSDDFSLFAFNISIDGSVIVNQTDLNTMIYIYNLTKNISYLTPGKHILTTDLFDGHTAKEKREKFKFNNGLFNQYSKYTFKNDGYIKTELKEGSLNDNWASFEHFDRYTQELRPSNPSSTITLIEESNIPIHIIDSPESNKKYKDQWIIINDNWKDYVIPAEPDSKVSIKRINDYKVEVKITGIKNSPEKIVFSSIGPLNRITKNYTFFTIGSVLTFSETLFETETEETILSFEKYGNVTTTALLYWNDSLKSSSKFTNSTHDVYTSSFVIPFITNSVENKTLFWDFNISGAINISANITNNQTIYKIALDNCTDFSTHAINFSLIDESTGEPVIGTVRTTIHTWYLDTLLYRENSFEFEGRNNYSICMFPSFASYLSSSYSFEYLAAGFTTEEYMFSNLVLSNETKLINLYLNNETLTSDVVVTLRDTDDNILEGYTIRVKRFYPGTGEEITTEITQTDHNGNTVIHLVLNDVYYSISIEKDGDVIEIITPAKYYTTSQLFIIDISEIILDFSDKVWYSTSPDSPVLGEPINFSLFTTSPGGYIDYFAIRTTFNGSEYENIVSSTTGGTATIELDLTNKTGWLNIEYSIYLDDGTYLDWVGGYKVMDFIPGGYSADTQGDDWKYYFGIMWRVIVAVFISIVAVLVSVGFIGTEAAGIVGLLVQIYFVIKEWIPVWMILIEAVILIGMYIMGQRGEA